MGLPRQATRNIRKKVMLTREWNNRVKHYLQKGGTVLLLADTAQVKSDVPPCFPAYPGMQSGLVHLQIL